jgi:hypothetical protein
MFQRRSRSQDMMLLSGWLFADLLLGLMVIFLVAAPPQDIPPPVLTVNPTALSPTDPHCNGGIDNAHCSVVVTETAQSKQPVDWSASSDMSDNVSFTPASGRLSPGHSITITIAAFPCQYGSFTFKGSHGTIPTTIAWRCTPSSKDPRLDFKPQPFSITVQDVNGLLAGSPTVTHEVEQQVTSQPFLANSSVGLVIAYGGAPNDADISQAKQIAQKIYDILGALADDYNFKAFQRASYYHPLYAIGNDPDTVQIDVYLFI